MKLVVIILAVVIIIAGVALVALVSLSTEPFSGQMRMDE